MNSSTLHLEPLVSRADVWAGDTECDVGQIPANMRTDFSDGSHLIEDASSDDVSGSKEGTTIGAISVTDVSGWAICRRCCDMKLCSFSAQHPIRCKQMRRQMRGIHAHGRMAQWTLMRYFAEGSEIWGCGCFELIRYPAGTLRLILSSNIFEIRTEISMSHFFLIDVSRLYSDVGITRHSRLCLNPLRLFSGLRKLFR